MPNRRICRAGSPCVVLLNEQLRPDLVPSSSSTGMFCKLADDYFWLMYIHGFVTPRDLQETVTRYNI